MTKHSIVELDRQVQQARSALAAAQKRVKESERRLHIALVEDTGWKGKVAYSGDREILVNDVEFIGFRPHSVVGNVLKKDRTVGLSFGRMLVSSAYFYEYQKPERVSDIEDILGLTSSDGVTL